MKLFFRNKDLELQGIIEGFVSLRWQRRYFTNGDFELHVRLTERNKKLIQDGMVITREDVPEAGVIETHRYTDKGEENAVAKGRLLSSIFDRRAVQFSQYINAPAEVAMRQLVDANCISPTNHDRIIDRLKLAPLRGFPQTLEALVEDADLLATLTDFSKVSNLGFRIRPDVAAKDYTFEIYEGADRSIAQDENPHIIFSDEFHNINEVAYEYSSRNIKNVVTVYGVDRDEAQRRVTVGTGRGWDRREGVYESSLSQDDEMSLAEFVRQLTNEAGQMRLSASKVEKIEAQINRVAVAQYGTDFDLGDIVTAAQKRWGKSINVRITEVLELIEGTARKITPTFGNPAPSIIDLLKKGV